MRNIFILCVLSLLVLPGGAIAQRVHDGAWYDIPESTIPVSGERDIIPAQYRTLALAMETFTAMLQQAPMEGTVSLGSSPLIVSLPLPAGGYGRFHVVESPIMAPGLAVRYPQIRTYLGQGIDDGTASVRFDITPAGFHAMILSANATVFIDPYSRGNTRSYISYFKHDLIFNISRRSEEIGVVDPGGEMAAEISRLVTDRSNSTLAIGDQLRTYRLALACTGEYAAVFGGTVSGALAAMVTAMNRVDGVYEHEVAIRMVLVANNDQIIYTNASTDPYTNNNGSTMLGQNQTTIDNVIGSANYDIGHVFSTGGGGVAGLGVICRSGQKARGVTGSSSPIGDGFYIDYVAHEMGHEFGANHPFNSVTSNCGGGNRNASTAYEPGSGTTIMAYAGICGADDLQPHSDDYFHIISLDEIVAYTTGGSGNGCAVITQTGNTPPLVDAGTGGNTIPIGTSFFLTGSGSDPDGDTLTYTWEEFDLGPSGSPNTPSGNAPIFRSFKGTGDPSRIFPRLSNILNNTQVIGEILPSYARNLSFRITARDNRAGGGGVTRSPAITLTVSGTSGPFAVTRPNTSITWLVNSTDTVRWNVANTDQAPVNCPTVNILLSTDGGQTFPITLAGNTPNDGVEVVAVPNILTQNARVKIAATNNIFFDLSNVAFAIAPVAAPVLVAPSNGATNQPTSLTLRWRGVAGATTYYVQASTDPSFLNTIINDSTLTDTVRNVSGLSNNILHYWRVRTTSALGASGWTDTWNFRTIPLPPATPTLSSPLNGSTNQPASLTMRWNAVLNVTTYRLEIAQDSAFTTSVLDDSTITTNQKAVVLSNGATYYWRVRAKNGGGSSAPTATWNFSTSTTSVNEAAGTPATFVLSQNYPNPFNPSTVIAFALPHEAFVTLEIFNLLGERVALLTEGKRPAGYYSATFNATGLSTGLYLYRLKAGDFVQTKKLVLVR